LAAAVELGEVVAAFGFEAVTAFEGVVDDAAGTETEGSPYHVFTPPCDEQAPCCVFARL